MIDPHDPVLAALAPDADLLTGKDADSALTFIRRTRELLTFLSWQATVLASVSRRHTGWLPGPRPQQPQPGERYPGRPAHAGLRDEVRRVTGNDADVALITNRDTGYRWILHRESAAVEFQTPGMLTEQVARDHLNVNLSVEEAEALADAAESAEISDKRRAAIVRQATEQIRLLAGQVREARRRAETEPDVHRRASLRPGFLDPIAR
jgi:hypothetical protein